MLVILDPDSLEFPAVDTALTDPNGLLAMGGDLSPKRLLRGYAQGIFPWYSSGQPILWWSPNPRHVFYPEQLHIAKSLHKTLHRNLYKVTFDQAFTAVIRGCAAPRSSDAGTWITPEMEHAYIQLHQLGYAHSVEIWDKHQQLVGGLYGVALGLVFFGESMFSLANDASKVALVYLCGQLAAWHFKLIDCQFATEHLTRLGAKDITRDEFTHRVKQASAQNNTPGPWTLDWSY